jgi:hypothetical protein
MIFMVVLDGTALRTIPSDFMSSCFGAVIFIILSALSSKCYSKTKPGNPRRMPQGCPQTGKVSRADREKEKEILLRLLNGCGYVEMTFRTILTAAFLSGKTVERSQCLNRKTDVFSTSILSDQDLFLPPDSAKSPCGQPVSTLMHMFKLWKSG